MKWCWDSMWPGIHGVSGSARVLCFSCIFYAGNVSLAFQPRPITPLEEGRDCGFLNWWHQDRTPICLFFHTINKALIYNKMTEEAHRQVGGWREVLQWFTCKCSYRLSCKADQPLGGRFSLEAQILCACSHWERERSGDFNLIRPKPYSYRPLSLS